MNCCSLRLSGRLAFGRVPLKKNFPRFDGRSPRQKMLDESMHLLGVEQFAELTGRPNPLRTMDLTRLSNLQNSPKRPRRGLKGITAYGRNMVRDAATALEQKYGRKQLSFWTVTIPPENLTREVVKQWSHLIKLFRQMVQYHLSTKSLPPHLLSVTEVQPSRYLSDRSVPPLHIHAVFVGRSMTSHWAFSPAELSNLWGDLLERVSGIPARRESLSSVQGVRKSCASYLGKYMSKGSCMLEGLNEALIPHAWYSCTRALSQFVKSKIVRLSGAAVSEFFEYVRRQPSLFRFGKLVTMQFGEAPPIAVGWYGDTIDEQARSHLEDMILQLSLARAHSQYEYQEMRKNALAV